jgi:DivIVA domain-containing protein
MDLRAEDVRARRFTVTRWHRGYDVAEVDVLLERAASALEELAAGAPAGPAHPALTGEEVRSSTFGTTLRRTGYDEAEVDEFLDALAEALDAASVSPR